MILVEELEGGGAGGVVVAFFVLLLEAGVDPPCPVLYPATMEEKLSDESAVGDEIDMYEFVTVPMRLGEPATGPVVVGLYTLVKLA